MAQLIELSHSIEDGMVTYPGLPGPVICDFLSREASRARYGGEAEFQIGKIELVANTGTYVDSPFHRYADGADLASLELWRLAGAPGVTVHIPAGVRAVEVTRLEGHDVEGKAVLVHTGFDRHFRTEAYLRDNPYLTREASQWLVMRRPALVGIDSLNIDDIEDLARPAHTLLLGAGIPVCEHLRNLAALPDRGYRFFAVPPKIVGMGTFPVRAYAEIAAAGGGAAP